MVGALELHRAALRIDEDLLIAVETVQSGFVGALDAEFADQVGTRVAGPVDAIKIVFADRRHVTQSMHAEFAIGIVAGLAGAKFHALGTRSDAPQSARSPRR